MAALHLAGAAAFLWPFIWPAPQVSGAARASDAPWIMAVAGLLLVGVLVSEVTGGRMSSKTIAVLGVLTAMTAMLRVPGSFAGASLFFLLPLCSGFAYGPTFGFLAGALGMVASALITGGIGPWLPFQVFAAGWVGGGAGAVGLLAGGVRGTRREVAALAATGALAAVFYGLVINLYFWPVVAQGGAAVSWRPGMGWDAAVSSYLRFYLLTSAWWDAIGAVGNSVILAAIGGPALFLLRRSHLRMDYALPVERVSRSSTPA